MVIRRGLAFYRIRLPRKLLSWSFGTLADDTRLGRAMAYLMFISFGLVIVGGLATLVSLVCEEWGFDWWKPIGEKGIYISFSVALTGAAGFVTGYGILLYGAL